MRGRNEYSYNPISVSRLEIRLLILAPAFDLRAPVRCKLGHSTLDPTPPNFIPRYEALSYVWSEPPGKSTIYLQRPNSPKEVPFEVTKNLESALRHVRDPTKFRLLWVDALCIDQNNEREKGEQVPLMGKIYAHASQDILWMGADFRRYDLCSTILDRTYADDFTKRSPIIATIFDGLNPVAKQQLARFFDAIVWKRMWIVQELVLSQDITVACGKKTFRWDSVFQVADFFMSQIARYPLRGGIDPFGGLLQITSIQKIRDRHDPEWGDLFRIWSVFGWSNCRFPQDKVFALVNIVREKNEIIPNYETPLRDLYCDITRTYVLRHKNLKFLYYGYDRGSGIPSSTQCLPSWAPDFGICPPRWSQPLYDKCKPKESKGYLLPWSPASTSAIQRSRQFQLNLLGVTLDVISEVGYCTRKWPVVDTVKYYQLICDKIERSTQPGVTYFNGQNRKGACFITLCCGHMEAPVFNLHRGIIMEAHQNLILGDQQEARKKSPWRKLFSSSASKHRVEVKAQPPLDQPFGAVALQFPVWEQVYKMTAGKSFAMTNSGYMALVPDFAVAGDVIAALNGGSAPFILRGWDRKGEVIGEVSPHNTEFWQCIGPAYVHGLMGDVPRKWRDEGRLREKTYILV